MRKRINVAIAGVGNCASAFIQGIQYYGSKYSSSDNDIIGLTSFDLGGYEPSDINFVAAFDVANTKVGKDLSDAILASPNNAMHVVEVPPFEVKVSKGNVLDGFGRRYSEKVQISDHPQADVVSILKDSKADILINYLPVGSREASKFYAEKCLESGVCFINAMPVFIASDQNWQNRFIDKNIPCAGDDVMSQIGATVIHKTLAKLLVDRGVSVDETFQLNVGGDMDFYNMLDEDRLEDKRVSKTSAVKSMIPYDVPMRIGPSDYISFLQNDKICYIYVKGRILGAVPIELDLKLRVPDAYNSAGVMIDAVRGAKIALDRNISGPLESISAYCFKHPPVQMSYSAAKSNFVDFVNGKKDK